MSCHPAGRNGDLLIWKGDVLATLYREETLDSDHALRFPRPRVTRQYSLVLEAGPLRR